MAKSDVRILAAAIALIACIVLFSSGVGSAITCPEVAKTVAGCLKYIQNGGSVPPGCCVGAQKLYALSTAGRQQACSCLKIIARSYPGINPDFLASVPSKCGVNVGFKISLNTDCSKVK